MTRRHGRHRDRDGHDVPAWCQRTRPHRRIRRLLAVAFVLAACVLLVAALLEPLTP